MQEFLITAVDIGTKKISASSGISKKGEEVEILGSSCVKSEGVERGNIVDRDECKKAFLEVMTNLEKEIGREIKDICFGLRSSALKLEESSYTLKLEGEKVTRGDLVRVIDKCKKNINIDDEYEICDTIVNYYKIDETISTENVLGFEGEYITVNLIIILGKKSILNNYRYLCDGTKYNLQEFVVNIISLRKIFLQNNNKIEKKAIVEVGSALTEIAVFNDGVVRDLMSIPLGGNDITSDLSICANIKIDEAENIKQKFSYNIKSLANIENDDIEIDNKKVHKDLFYKVCEARIEEILNYVKNELKKGSHNNDICSIILCGDALTNFESISDNVLNVLGKNVLIVTKNDLYMQNLSNITSLAIVKEVHDRVELIYEDSLKIDEELESIRNYLEKDSNENVEVKEFKRKKENMGFVGKIKSFLEDMF